MDGQPTLPSELLLLIVECAALHAAEDPLHMGWAASLCLVCRSFRRVATPIIYTHVVVTKKNIEHIGFLPHEAPATLACTRSVTFDGYVRGIYRRTGVLESLIRAMTSLRSYTGNMDTLEFIHFKNEDIIIPSIFLTGMTTSLADDNSFCIPKATRLHIVVPLGDPPVAFPKGELSLEYLMIDVLAEDESAWEQFTPEFLQHVDGILGSLKSVRRILLRPRCLSPWYTSERFNIEVEECGRTKRDSRIWINDSIGPSWRDNEGTNISNTLYIQDAVVGDELWLSGRQLCPASVPVHVSANEQ